MIKDMFIANIPEINEEICATLCDGEMAEKRFAEDEFGNHVYIDDNGQVVAWMHEYEPEDYVIASSLDDFYNRYPLYTLDEVLNIIRNTETQKILKNLIIGQNYIKQKLFDQATTIFSAHPNVC